MISTGLTSCNSLSSQDHSWLLNSSPYAGSKCLKNLLAATQILSPEVGSLVPDHPLAQRTDKRPDEPCVTQRALTPRAHLRLTQKNATEERSVCFRLRPAAPAAAPPARSFFRIVPHSATTTSKFDWCAAQCHISTWYLQEGTQEQHIHLCSQVYPALVSNFPVVRKDAAALHVRAWVNIFSSNRISKQANR